MPKRPTKAEIQVWIPAATDIFKAVMPPISVPYPQTYISDSRNFRAVRTQLVDKLGCKHADFPEDSVIEYIHGEKGYAILIRQNLLYDNNDEHFCWLYWHELGHFYAINLETADLHRYNDPGLADDSHILEYATTGKDSTPIPVMGLSGERLKQEGY